ncbi:MAG: putative hybrid sensor histidine kinase [Pseudonocardiales bacterium]|nr:putative hybrid sensor histidine kinase [Pseudonocardiales bacterium]
MTDRFAAARVLVVDDNEANVALLKAVLGRANYDHVFTESDPRRVLSRLSEVDPDLILLDLHMPQLDGFAVLEQIRGFAPSEYLPVLVLTADTTSGALLKALAGGAQDFVTKPFNNAEVLLRIHNLLEARFMYTTLRGSILRRTREWELEQNRLTTVLASERNVAQGLRLSDELKDALLHTVYHDLRSPIAAILAIIDMLAADGRGEQPLALEVRLAFIQNIETSARQMDRLLTDLLDSDSTRRVRTTYQPCDIGELVRRAICETDLDSQHPVVSDLPSIWVGVDPSHVERIVINLLNNVDRHVAPGVPVWVRASPHNQGVLLSVDDAGPGIDPATARTIFEPFRTGDSTHPASLGLGLSLVQRFAKIHGGSAWVEQRPGGGAAFRVFLPSHVAASNEEVGSAAGDRQITAT